MCSQFNFYKTNCSIWKLWRDRIYKIYDQLWRNMTPFLPNRDEWWHSGASENCPVSVKIVQCFRRRSKRQILVLTLIRIKPESSDNWCTQSWSYFPLLFFVSWDRKTTRYSLWEIPSETETHSHMHIQAHAYSHTERVAHKGL